MPEQDARHYVGLDAAKRQLDYALDDTTEGCLPHTAAGLATLVEQVRAMPHACVIVESTGGYERPVVAALVEAGLEVCLVSPGRVRAFALAEGLLAKTDRLDARLLRRFGQKMAPRGYVAPPEAVVTLRALLDYRRLVVAQLAELTSRQETAVAVLAELLRTHEAWLQETLAQIDARIAAHLAATPELQIKAARLEQVKGVGPVLAATLLAHVPELGQLSDKKVSALVGVAPHPRDSATTSRPRQVRGGRPIVRRVLYMSAVCAARFNPILALFYQRLRSAGKPAKVALVAVMRKLLCFLNRLLADPDFALAH